MVCTEWGKCHAGLPCIHVLRRSHGMGKLSSPCGVPIRAGSPRPTSVYSTYLPSPVPYTEHPRPLLISVRGGPGGGCGAVLLLHRSLEDLMKSFCEVQTRPLPQAGRGQATSSRTPEHSATRTREQVYQFYTQV